MNKYSNWQHEWIDKLNVDFGSETLNENMKEYTLNKVASYVDNSNSNTEHFNTKVDFKMVFESDYDCQQRQAFSKFADSWLKLVKDSYIDPREDYDPEKLVKFNITVGDSDMMIVTAVEIGEDEDEYNFEFNNKYYRNVLVEPVRNESDENPLEYEYKIDWIDPEIFDKEEKYV